MCAALPLRSWAGLPLPLQPCTAFLSCLTIEPSCSALSASLLLSRYVQWESVCDECVRTEKADKLGRAGAGAGMKTSERKNREWKKST